MIVFVHAVHWIVIFGLPEISIPSSLVHADKKTVDFNGIMSRSFSMKSGTMPVTAFSLVSAQQNDMESKVDISLHCFA